MKSLLKLVKSHWLLFTVVIGLPITILSLYPVDSLPSVPGTDKTHHFIAYAALAFPIALARPKKWLLFIVGLLAYSGIIELIQPHVYRYGEWLDLGANGLGLVVGVLMASLARSMTLKDKSL
ncbi:VanZ family protein [Thalassotalea ponticola]|uniref:VanZ family protein n=1 Tax=Thalassotalea ponticola TaxID=1523392 RepID=UPI0025B46B30|nr:VanZ family protein [Thalassotalea ponticola]MDN3652517.1 VanZ family protein [Thalassotalea ponticola]